MRRRVYLPFAVLLLCAASAYAGEIKPEAKTHLDSGLKLYEKKDYAGAIQEFEQGYAIDPAPEFLYAEAQAERMKGDCKSALGHYQAFLDTKPAPEREAAALANIARCKAEIGENPPPVSTGSLPPTASAEPPPLPPPSAAPPPSASTPPAPVGSAPNRQPERKKQSEPFYTDVFGDVLVGAGIVALGASGALYLTSLSNENRAKDDATGVAGGTYQQHVDRIDRAGKQRTESVVLGSIGLALVTGGVLHYVLRSPPESGPEVGAWVAPKTLGLSYGSAF